MVRVLCTLPQGPQLPSRVSDQLAASATLAAESVSRGCDLLAATFLPAAASGAASTRDLPDLVQAELQRLLLSLKARLSMLACTPDGTEGSVLRASSGLGFKGRNLTSLQDNPLFPQSPSARTSGEGSMRASLGHSSLGFDGSSDILSTPEPYQCNTDFVMPSPTPPLMCLVVYLVCEVRRDD